MADSNTRFTALGMSGSGKTCYVLGMYYQMITGLKGFSLKAENSSVGKLEAWMDKLDEECGMNRFPAGTALTEVSDYEFKLKYALQDVMTFNWIDYGGGTLKARDNNPEAYQMLLASIEQSPVLYVFLDGELLCCEDSEARINTVKKKVRTINAFLLEYSEHHQDEMLPIVFVITKGDICADYINDDEISVLMKRCFDFLMVKGIRFYVTMVTLGKEIAEGDYSGEADPKMHIPIFLGIYHTFLNFCFALKKEIMDEENRNNEAIMQNRKSIDNERNKTGWGFLDRLLCDEANINYCRMLIDAANETIQSNRQLFDHYKKLMNAVSAQLLRDSEKFKMFEDGVEKDFDANESFEL